MRVEPRFVPIVDAIKKVSALELEERVPRIVSAHRIHRKHFHAARSDVELPESDVILEQLGHTEGEFGARRCLSRRVLPARGHGEKQRRDRELASVTSYMGSFSSATSSAVLLGVADSSGRSRRAAGTKQRQAVSPGANSRPLDAHIVARIKRHRLDLPRDAEAVRRKSVEVRRPTAAACTIGASPDSLIKSRMSEIRIEAQARRMDRPRRAPGSGQRASPMRRSIGGDCTGVGVAADMVRSRDDEIGAALEPLDELRAGAPVDR